MRSRRTATIALTIAIVFAARLAGAQNIGATLQGLILDEQHAVLPGVSVTITNIDTGIARTVTTDASGWYRAAALAPGNYEIRAELSGFVEHVRRGLTLTTGQEPRIDITLSVASVKETVTVTGETPLVDVTRNTIGTTITRRDLDSIPLVDRNFLSLANMTPGVTGVGGGGVNTAGQLNRNNSYLVDGVSNDDTIVSSSRGGFSLEAVREYIVLANQFTAEYGISSGAIVSVVTRSGTNKNEGRAFFFDRDQHLDAQDPFSHAQGSGKAPFSQQRWGGFWGGPLSRDRLFYFASYEGLHIAETSVVTTPLVPVDQREWPKPTNEHQGFVKIDNQVSAGHSISGRYRIDRNLQIANGIGGINTHDRGSDSLTRDQDGVLSDTLVLSNRALNEFRFQASQRYNNIDPTPYSPIGTPDIRRPSGNLGKANNLPQWRRENRFQFVDNFSFTRGSHDVKVGSDISIIRGFSYFPRTNDGQFMFATDRAFDPADLSTYPFQYTVEHFNPYFDLPNELYSLFAQDSWRAGGRLTLNFGVRYDVETSYRKINGVPDDHNNVQPRVGFVWAPFGNPSTAVRGGYGLYVDRSFLNVQLDVAAAQNSQTIVIQNPGYPDPFSRGTLGAVTPSATVIADHPKAPETESFSLGVQRELRPGLSASADGVYSRGRYLFNNRDLNYPLVPGGPRPDPSFGRIIQFGMEGNSWSTALLTNVQYRPQHGPSFGVSYTLSKALRDVEDFQFFAQDELNPAADKGPANNDRRHQVVVNFNWSLPAGLQIAGLASARSGLPWNVTTGVDSNLDTQTNDRPDLAVPGGNPLDKATYFANFTGRVGNLPRNYNLGPDYFSLDMRLSKYLTMPRLKVELFAEAFNLTNFVNLGTPVGNLRSTTFGQSTALAMNAAPRRVELGVRVNF
jgi:carboxypeptidase family protein/TonB-dependent receptor-like protein